MDITVEIGTEEQQTQINAELTFFAKFPTFTDPPLNISRLIVPADFDRTVNGLQRTTQYTSTRDVQAVAKNINLGDSTAIILSKHLYTESHDTQTRCYIFLHEMFHVANKRKFPSVDSSSPSTRIYVENLYAWFDEYVADRLAYECMDRLFPSKSPYWEGLIQREISGFTALINDPAYYSKIKSNIALFRRHGNVNLFLERIVPVFDSTSICIAHIFALADHNPTIVDMTGLLTCPFVNSKTTSLFRFFREKYELSAYDVHDGLQLVRDFMENFAIRFEDRSLGRYCHVLDI